MEESKTKRCNHCKNVLPFECFSNNRRNSDGKQNYCKKCSRESNKKYLNSFKGKQTRTKYRKSIKGKQIHRESNKKWYNKEDVRQKQINYSIQYGKTDKGKRVRKK